MFGHHVCLFASRGVCIDLTNLSIFIAYLSHLSTTTGTLQHWSEIKWFAGVLLQLMQASRFQTNFAVYLCIYLSVSNLPKSKPLLSCVCRFRLIWFFLHMHTPLCIHCTLFCRKAGPNQWWNCFWHGKSTCYVQPFYKIRSWGCCLE